MHVQLHTYIYMSMPMCMGTDVDVDTRVEHANVCTLQHLHVRLPSLKLCQDTGTWPDPTPPLLAFENGF